MSDKRPARSSLLRSLLSTLIEEWGYETVRGRLNELRPPGVQQFDTSHGREGDSGGSRASEKPTARVLAARVSVPPGQKKLIEQLAVRFESKEFLPTSGDIRYFFEVHGVETPPPGKQRSEAFRKVLRVLCAMPEAALQQMIDNEAHSGPSRLAPLSEAMRGMGEQRLGGQGVGGADEDLDATRQAHPRRSSDA